MKVLLARSMAEAKLEYLDAMNTMRLPGDDLFRLLIDRVRDYAIFALDPEGIVSSWNEGAQHIKGYRADEIIGHHFSRFYPEEAIRSGWPMHELAEARVRGSFEDEGWRVRKDGSRFWANVIITALFDDSGELRGFAKVTRDLTERKRVERLEADAHTMGQFVAMLAHELRNPLAPIHAAVELASHPDADRERVQWALGIVRRQSGHLSKLVDDLLEVSRVTQGRIRLERRRMRLSEALEAAVEAIGSSCDTRGHSLSVERRSDPVVRGDVVRLTQIITNLLGNACKYTPNGGRIQVRLDIDGQDAVLTVSDNGVGIPDDLLPRIFDLFTQDRRSLDRSDGGLGLGLAISKRLAEMHRGQLMARSAGRGCGSEFTLRIPVVPGSDDVASDRLNVLIVDDNEDAALTMQALLEQRGHACSVAFDGEKGLELASRIQPDFVMLDIGLPGLNGYEVARRLRRLPQLEGVVLAAVTGYGSAEDRREALEAGFDHHFAKPVAITDLVERLPLLAGKAR